MSLRRAVIAVRENYAQAMAVTAPLGSVVSTTTAALAYAGKGVVLATIMAFIASALWIYTLTIYSRRIASAGGYYTYVYAAYRSRFLTFSEAFIEVLSFIFLNVVNILAVYLMVEALFSLHGIQLPQWAGFMLIVFSLAYTTLVSILVDIKKLLGTLVTIVASLEVIILFLLFSISIKNGFNIDFLLPPSDANITSMAIAFLLVLVSIDGAGAATYLGEETRNPLDNVAKGIWLAFLIGGLAMIFGTYAIIALWPYSYADLASSSQPLIVITAKLGIVYMLIITVIAVKSLLISNIGTTLAASRILFNLSREDSAPRILSQVNRRGQPIVATLLVGLTTTALTFLSLAILDPRTAFIEIGAITAIFWISGRILDSLGAPLFLYRMDQLGHGIRMVYHIVIPIVTSLMNIAGLILTIAGINILHITILGVLAVIGLAWYLVMARFGAPGSLIVDNYNNIIRIDEFPGKKN